MYNELKNFPFSYCLKENSFSSSPVRKNQGLDVISLNCDLIIAGESQRPSCCYEFPRFSLSELDEEEKRARKMSQSVTF